MDKRKYITYILFLAVFGYGEVRAQLDNSFFYDIYPLGKQYEKNLYFDVEALGYVRNNEYYTKTVNGYTLFGYQIKPEISYYPSKNFRIGIGGFFQRDFGDDGFLYKIPTFSIKYQADSLKIVFGTLEGALTHHLIEPVFGFERLITDRIEEGVQLKWHRKAFYLDTWFDWQNMIRKGDEELEEFVYGMNLKPVLYHRNNSTWLLIGQLTLKHQGGQIDNTDLEEKSIGNLALGFSYRKEFEEGAWVTQLKTDNFYLMANGTEDAYVIDYNSGYGIYLNIDLARRNFHVMGSYWYGMDFIAPQGGEIYQSISYNYPEEGYYEQVRQLFILRLMWEKQFEGGLSIGVRYEPFYDIMNNTIDSSQGLYLRYRGKFKIASLGKIGA